MQYFFAAFYSNYCTCIKQTFQINLTATAKARSLIVIPITIRVVEVNDPPVIHHPSTTYVQEGMLPVFVTMRLYFEVTDPDDGNENGWGNITVTSPGKHDFFSD